ncbi:ATP synthase F0 subcomplex A subunit [Candidatus Kryptonium thompsonii]|uniref:ATP synthase subunit a n=1 Tax=Candidatus Kryptonium thompsonii TaxID=1633631 RepID=A0A0P1M6J4_9BACT|nr:F0F1 ATP synthase subunit A [Candidatus Kryptonium thompsoni]CUS77451.1 ATP synthase F0 subcomplex A subunit [Candidatus Kryptonium thompsoni]CUS78181.1 ATP synthase F0 subcomplex A subunit [Candidatus Kryptonium thompsoni]CUS81041.1 ATP synthase F0 subcomplex A subunit [Candidatus Kryptonium thompsoni]CUS82032.1 ATP synthase F0 subcomplex A subunit [Candidatus Kryptonium thompsoni]CUS89636.1 ATP synthase F0 subcomplex A subunit [Candidatus Kryptonium thompsoni]
MWISNLAVAADTLKHSGASHGGGESSDWMLHHISDSRTIDLEPFGHITLPQFPPIHIGGITIDLSITKHVFFMWLVSIILIVVLSLVARSYRRSVVPHGLANLVEVFVVFIRDEIILSVIGKEGLRYLHYFLTLFFFILLCNLFGLIPYGATATGNLAVTGGLAFLSFILIQIAGIRKHGLIGYYKGLVPHGVPAFVAPVMFIVEFLGLFAKAFALTVRLFANMTAGHIVILALIGLIFVFKSVLVAPISIAFAIFINFLEILVAFIQAYIFTMLTALFVGLSIHQH